MVADEGQMPFSNTSSLKFCLLWRLTRAVDVVTDDSMFFLEETSEKL